jgi:tRNA modification GTPase
MNRQALGSTIAAVSTAPGPGGIAIVRLSGPQAEPILARLFRPAQAPLPLDSHRLTLGHIVDPDTGRVLDEVLAVLMRSPRSYTREDMAEIHTHGGPVVTGRVLELALRTGARLAEPGEFTKRAFLAGRIDLSQAEAVAELIAAKGRAEAELAMAQLAGGLKDRVLGLREPLLDVLAHLEVALDFPDEEAEILEPGEAAARLEQEALAPLDELLASYQSGRLFREGLELAIIGRPNVGKSSLLNRLLGDERAIVTSAPGTTRDLIEAETLIGGIPLTLVDTAGLETPARDEAEAEGQRRARARTAEADLVLLVLDGSGPLGDEDRRLLDLIRDRTLIGVLNKMDLPPAFDPAEAASLLAPAPVARVSAKTGQGLDDLKALILETVAGGRTRPDRLPALVPNARHGQALEEARGPLLAAIEGLKGGLPPEIVALEIQTVLDRLGRITGQTLPEDVLDRIFEAFCLGK